MLVLTRRTGESVMVGDDVIVTVLDVRADTVRLGIQAPRDIAVHREEVYEEIRAANKAAASPQDESIAELRRRLRARRARPGDAPAPGAGEPAATSEPAPAGGPVPESGPTPESGPGADADPASP